MGAQFGEDNVLQILIYLTCVIANDVTNYTMWQAIKQSKIPHYFIDVLFVFFFL
jgi:hypothetical protein